MDGETIKAAATREWRFDRFVSEFSWDIDLRATTRGMGLVLDFLSPFRRYTGALIPVNTVQRLAGIKY